MQGAAKSLKAEILLDSRCSSLWEVLVLIELYPVTPLSLVIDFDHLSRSDL